ncbi:hypothetical protein LguiB_003961 [Lonicera macranthoides]
MKKIQRFFGRASISSPPDECGSGTSVATPTTSAARPSSARRRSTERRTQPENYETPTTQPSSSSSPFANYKRVVDDGKYISRMKRTAESGLFYIRSTWHQASGIYKRLSRDPNVEMLLDNSGLCSLFKRQMPNFDLTVVKACCRRWWDTTHTFHLPTCELGFTPLDFTMLIGTHINFVYI